MNKVAILAWDELEPLKPAYALVGEVDRLRKQSPLVAKRGKM